MPISVTSYLFLSNAFSTDRAESSEISCSPERPPNNTARLSFANACLRPPRSRSRSFPLPHPPGRFDQPAGKIARGVLEHRAPTGPAGLGPLAILGQLRHPLLHGLLIAGLQAGERRPPPRPPRAVLRPVL